MALLFRIQCEQCKCSPNPEENDLPYIFPEDSERALILPHGYAGLRLDDGKIEPLPHPGEAYRMAELGFTSQQAQREKRLFWIDFRVCKRCGSLVKEIKAQESNGLNACLTGCLVPLFFGAIIAFLSHLFGMLSWIYACILGCFSTIAFQMIFDYFALSKSKLRQSKAPTIKCSRCQSSEVINLNKAKSHLVMCPHCNTENMRYEIWGIS